MKQFFSTKTYTHAQGLSACFRQWRAQSHCKFLHGYALQVEIVFGATELDERNWVADFGALKPIKEWLEKTFDHKTLVAVDDPLLGEFRELDRIGMIQLVTVPSTGCEKFAELIYDYVSGWVETYSGERPLNETVWVESVTVREHAGNSAICKKQ